ncbi:hypothetical protein SESBI_08595 [Sesbania bispinosa]|nr:hypothetical protein SESBI_08595 [Sesbania bispinosa]
MVMQQQEEVIWHKMKRVLVALLKPRKSGAGLLKLEDDVESCEYEDIQVMWEMLQRTEAQPLPLKDNQHSHKPFWRRRIFV